MSFVTRYLEPALVERLNHLQVSARSVVEGSITGLHRSPMKGASVEFRQHRFYAPGDELRHLNWRVLARTDRPYIKEYDEETNLRCLLMLDCSGSMAYGRPKTRAEIRIRRQARRVTGVSDARAIRKRGAGPLFVADRSLARAPGRDHATLARDRSARANQPARRSAGSKRRSRKLPSGWANDRWLSSSPIASPRFDPFARAWPGSDTIDMRRFSSRCSIPTKCSFRFAPGRA